MRQRTVRLQHKIFLYYSLLVILSTILFGYYAYQANVQTAETNFTSAVSGSMNQTTEGVANLLAEAEKQANLFAGSHVVRESLAGGTVSAAVQYDRYINLERVVDAYEENYEAYGLKIYLDPPRRFMNDDIRYFPATDLPADGSPAFLFRRNSTLSWSLLDPSGAGGNADFLLACYRAIRSPDDFGELLGTVAFDIRASAVASIMNSVTFPEERRMYMFDGQGEVIFDTDATGEPKGRIGEQTMGKIRLKPEGSLQTERQGTDKELLVYRTVEGYPFYLAVDIPLSELSNRSKLIMTNFIWVALLVLTVSFVVAYFIARGVTRRLKSLMKAMGTVETHEFNVKVPEGRSDEIGILTRRFNWMVERIRTLIEDVYKSDLEKKEAELKLLQAQVNPHFLYNALDSVHWLSVKHDAPDIGYMVRNLSAFLRLSLHVDGMTTLENELKHTKAYFNIQKYRFEDRIELVDELPPELYAMEVIPLILQPLVENAILHGILPQGDRIGQIVLSGEAKEGKLILRVRDNGAGMDEARLAAIKERLESDKPGEKGTGLRNVHRRVRFRYGEPYGLKAEAAQGGGMLFVLTLPAVMEGDFRPGGQPVP